MAEKRSTPQVTGTWPAEKETGHGFSAGGECWAQTTTRPDLAHREGVLCRCFTRTRLHSGTCVMVPGIKHEEKIKQDKIRQSNGAGREM
jgi:hypothetical protein